MAALSTPLGQAAAQPSERLVERWLERGDQAAAQGRTARALGAYRRVVREAPHEPRGALGLAAVLLPALAAPAIVSPSDALRGRADEVKTACDEALRRTPRYRTDEQRSLRRARAHAQAVAGDHRGAIESMAGTMGRLDTEVAGRLAELSALAIRRHDLVAADRGLELARRADPQDLSLVHDQAAVRSARGRPGEAVTLLRDLLARAPETPGARRDLASALLAAGQAERALRMFDLLLDECSEGPRCHRDLARAALEAGVPERAVTAAQEARRRAPRDGALATILGLALAQAGDRDGAAEAFRAALALDPQDARAREGLRALTAEPAP